MKSVTITCAVAALAALALAGCGKGTQSDSSSAAPSSGGGAVAAVSKYDAGPRAGEQPIDESKVKTGETLFNTRGCTACHAYGKKLAAPDLKGVTMRRTAAWMENQILHPEVMTKEDPIAHQLFAQYALQMTNQHLTEDEAKAVVEYFKHLDHESSEGEKH